MEGRPHPLFLVNFTIYGVRVPQRTVNGVYLQVFLYDTARANYT